MPELLHNGVYFFREAGTPQVVGVGTSTGGFILRARTGPHAEAGYADSFDTAKRLYGDLLDDNDPGMIAVKGFFDEGGTRCYLGRCVGTGAMYAATYQDGLAAVSDFDPAATVQDQGLKDGSLARDLQSTAASAELIGIIDPGSNPGYDNATFGGTGTDWVDNGLAVFDDTADLSITANAIGDSADLPNAAAGIVKGQYVELTFDLAGITDSWEIRNGTQVIGTAAANGSYTFRFLPNQAGDLKIVALTASAAGDFDNFSLTTLVNPAQDLLGVAGRWIGSLDDSTVVSTVQGATTIATAVDCTDSVASLVVANASQFRAGQLVMLHAEDPSKIVNHRYPGASYSIVRSVNLTTNTVTILEKNLKGLALRFDGLATPDSVQVGDLLVGPSGNYKGQVRSVTYTDGPTNSAGYVTFDYFLIDPTAATGPQDGDAITIGGVVAAVDFSVAGQDYFIPAGMWVSTATKIPYSTTTASALDLTLDTDIDLTDINTQHVKRGALLVVVNDDHVFSTLVKSVNGNKAKMAADLSAGVTTYRGNTAGVYDSLSNTSIPAGANVYVYTFSLGVARNGFAETFANLSPFTPNASQYHPSRLSGTGNRSEIVQTVDLSPSTLALSGDASDPASYVSSELHLAMPFPVSAFPLAGGNDGAALDAAAFIGGTTVAGVKTGLDLFDRLNDVNFFSTPGSQEKAVIAAALAKCKRFQDRMFITTTPSSIRTAIAARDYKNDTLNIDSEFGALYYSFVRLPNPLAPEVEIEQPADGFVQGIWSAVAAANGPHYPPANVPFATLNGTAVPISIGDRDILDPVGVNPIVTFPGQGIRIFGDSTMTSNTDGTQFVNTIRIMTFINSSIKRGALPFTFQPNNEELFEKVQNYVFNFLLAQFNAKMFVPLTDPSQAFFAVCNNNTTRLADQNAGKTICRYGFRPVKSSRQLIFNVNILHNENAVEIALAA